MYVISGHILYDITIGDKRTPFPIGTGNLQSLYITETIQQAAPQFEMIFHDIQGQLNNTISLSDGTMISIMLGKLENQQSLSYSDFRLFNMPKMTPGSGGQNYIIRGVLDAAKYIRGHVQNVYKGTSSQALSQLASDAGLTYQGIDTNDSQTWLPSRCSFFHAAHKIVQHGYVDDKSCMMHGVTLGKTLKYYNVTSLISQQPAAILYMGDPSQIPQNISSHVGSNKFQVWDYQAQSNSGLLNYHLGYGAKQTQEQLDGTLQVNSQIQATKFSNDFAISTDVYKQTQLVRNTYSPPNTGNTNAAYIAAHYQNNRQKTMFSSYIDVLCEDSTNLTLFDIVYLQLVDKVTRQNFTAFNGLYFVINKTYAIIGNKYYEKLRIINTGPYSDPSNQNI